MQQVTVITGGSRGIGAATARRLAADGHDLALGYRENAQAAEEVIASLVHRAVRCVAIRVDATREADVERLFAAASELGPVTSLVNNAGITSPMGRLADTRPED